MLTKTEFGYLRVSLNFPEWFGAFERDYGFYDSNYEYRSGNKDWDALWEAFQPEEMCTVAGGWAIFTLEDAETPAQLQERVDAWLVTYAEKVKEMPREDQDK
jgi:hypothetical protein